MKKNTIILFSILALLTFVYFIIVNKPWSNFKSERTDFSIKDTALITRMFFADKRNNFVLLEKNTDGTWMVNGRYKADMQKVNLMKATIHQMEVRNPVAESEYNTIIADIATTGIKAEFYHNKKLLKTIYVGGPTLENTGTYMLIENSSKPFITHIPGFVGYLTPRFNVFPIRWKDKEVFVYKRPEEIKTISVSYPQYPTQSYLIDNSGDMPVAHRLDPITQKTTPIVGANNNFTNYILMAFTSLYCEGHLDQYDTKFVDSVASTTPYAIINVQSNNGDERMLRIFFKPTDKRTKDRLDIQTGTTLEIDPEKYFGILDNNKDIMLIQDFTFGKVLRSANDFLLM
jgi:hypothetical protein